MILREELKIKLASEARFVDGLILLQNNQLVVLATTLNQARFQHYDFNSKLIRQHVYSHQILPNSMKSLEKDEAIFLAPESNKICTLNFKTSQKKEFQFKFRNSCIYRSKILQFLESKMYVVFETPQYSQVSAKFTFFKYPFQKIWEIQVKDAFTYNVQPINQYSMVGIYKGKMDKNFQIKILDSQTKQQKDYSFPKYGNHEYVIKSINQLKRNEYFLFCDSSAPQNRYLVFNSEKFDNKQDGYLRNFKFQLPEKIYQIRAKGQYLYVFQFQVDSVKNQQVQAPVLMIDRQTQNLVFKSTCRITHNWNYEFSTDGQNKMVLYKYPYHNCKQIEVYVEKLVRQKQLYLFMLTKIGNFDMNMLHSIIQAFEYD